MKKRNEQPPVNNLTFGRIVALAFFGALHGIAARETYRKVRAAKKSDTIDIECKDVTNETKLLPPHVY